MGTRGEWSKDFLKALGNSSPSASTINLVAAWTKAEGTKAKFNPLATTLNYGENTPFNSVNVRNFKTRQQGIEASVQTLQGKFTGYADIVRGLKTNDTSLALKGMHASPWGTNFAHVDLTFRTQDVTGERLLSEASDTPSPNTGERPNDYTPMPKPQVGNAEPNNVNINPATSEESVRNAGKILIGISCIIVSGILLIKTVLNTDAAKIATKVATKGLI
jgi:DNA uptake protein ComE-like DNA-binding protein